MASAKTWEQDLWANCQRRGWLSACAAFFASPGFFAVTLHRLAHENTRHGGFRARIGKFFWRLNVLFSGCHIAPTAEIGAGLCLPHPTGIVIGQVVKIGADVTLYQNVTLGSARAGGANDQPEIGNNVVIFAGAVIVGKISIGPNAKIGANAVVLDHVPAGAAAVGAPARIIESPFSFEQAA